jgi:tRNA pseudouridine(38-40) synthase
MYACGQVKLARAARTDAGVHAAGNVVSLKMIINIPGSQDVVTQINGELPPEIRLWGYVSFRIDFIQIHLYDIWQARVQKSFNARTCIINDSRPWASLTNELQILR